MGPLRKVTSSLYREGEGKEWALLVAANSYGWLEMRESPTMATKVQNQYVESHHITISKNATFWEFRNKYLYLIQFFFIKLVV